MLLCITLLKQLLVIFVHGYSVSSIDTYGELPGRLQSEAAGYGFSILPHEIFLSRYISFDDQVRLEDLASAFEAALQREIYTKYPSRRFICITHSTGAPLVRTWLGRYWKDGPCPLSHLLMLAPANHGSALAQLGKSRLSRIRSWFNGIEPGQRVLDWLELGSRGSWRLNKDYVLNGSNWTTKGVFHFVVTGQDIDRRMYDHINSYTGEVGSDGAVRVASANLNDEWLLLEQQLPAGDMGGTHLRISAQGSAPPTPLRIVKNRSHGQEEMGIMRSVRADAGNDPANAETVRALFRCFSVNDEDSYRRLHTEFRIETEKVQEVSAVEAEQGPLGTRYHIHDRQTMIIFRLRDSAGHAVLDYDLLLTAGPDSDPDALPPGFFTDRQCNCKDKSTLTYYLNYDVMKGSKAVTAPDGKVLREPRQGITQLGLTIIARPDKGLVRYLPAVLPAGEEFFSRVIRPNATSLVEIVLERLLSEELLRLENPDKARGDWKDVKDSRRYFS